MAQIDVVTKGDIRYGICSQSGSEKRERDLGEHDGFEKEGNVGCFWVFGTFHLLFYDAPTPPYNGDPTRKELGEGRKDNL